MEKKDRIVPSNYTAKEDLLDLVSNYFDIDEMNLLKTGFLGSLIEMNSHIFKHSVHHKNFLYDEFFPNTAKLPRSIHNFARNTNYDISSARPAVMTVFFAISKRDILKYGKEEKDQSIIFTIDKNNPFSIKEFNYLLAHDVKIVATKSGELNDYTITAFYDLDSPHKFPFSMVKSPYVKTWVESLDSVEYIMLSLDIWQVDRKVREFNVLSRDISDILIYDVSYSDQLAHFNLYYQYPLSSPKRELPSYFNNIFTPEGEEEFAYYNFNSDDELRIYFSGLPKTFTPAFNSIMEVEYFTTKGSRANFQYKETASIGFRFEETDLAPINVIVSANSDSAGGRDKETLKEIKKSVIRENFHRNNLATDKDLNNYFQNIIDSRSVNGSTISFFKKRDDVIRRIYNAYLLIRNSSGLVIPTNSIDLELDVHQIERLNQRLETGTIVVFDPDSRNYRLLRPGETINSFIKSDRTLVYSIPYLIRTHMDPVPRVSFYNNSIDKVVPLVFSRVNMLSKNEFLVNNLEIKRNSMLGEQYEFTVSLSTNMRLDEVTNNVKLVGTLKDSTGKIYGYIEFSLHDKIGSSPIQYVFKSRVLTKDQFDRYGRLELVNTVQEITTGETKRVNVEEDLSMSIALMYDNSSDKTKFDEFDRMGKFENYSTLFVMDTLETFTLSRNLDGIVHSDMEINQSGAVRIRHIPVVASRYFTKLKNFTEFYNILETYFDMIYSSLDNLQNNTSIDVKFYNTYGLSELFTIDTVNLSLELDISLVSSALVEHIDKEIKRTIIDFVYNANEDNFLSISNLTSTLENNIKEIRYIEFKSMNGMNVQKIEKLQELMNLDKRSREEVMMFTPEYLNIMHDFSDGSSLDSVPDIKINYV